MNTPLATIEYKAAEGKRICLEVSTEVKELLEQSDRQIRSQRRQDRRYLTNEEYIDGLTDTTTVYPHEDFADLLFRMCNYQRLYTAISQLPVSQKRRLTLYYFGGLTYRQIAKIEGVGFRTVARSVERALNTLRKTALA